MLGFGLIGIWGDRVQDGHTPIPAHRARLAMGITLEGRDAVAFLPFANIKNSRTGERLYMIDGATLRPRFSPYEWTTDEYRLDVREECALYASALPNAERGGVLHRYAPHWLERQRLRPTVHTAEEALAFVNSAMTPVDNCIGYRSAEEQVRHWLAQPDWEKDLPACFEAPKGGARQLDRYRVRAGEAGAIERLTDSYLRIKAVSGAKLTVRRPPGLQYAVGAGDSVEAGQPLFDVRRVEPGSPAHTALKRMWRRRMFMRVGSVEYVRLNFVTKVWPCCPICFEVLQRRDECPKCSARAGASVQGQAALPDLMVQPLRWSLNYTGNPAELAAVVPPAERLPMVSGYERRYGRRMSPRPVAV